MPFYFMLLSWHDCSEQHCTLSAKLERGKKKGVRDGGRKKPKVFSGELQVISSVRLRAKNNLNLKIIKN